MAMLLMLSAALPVFVRVTVCAALFWNKGVLENVRLTGDSVTAGLPCAKALEAARNPKVMRKPV